MFRNRTAGIFALAIVGGYFLYRNRAAVMDTLESWGINRDSLNMDRLSDSLRSGVNRLSSSVQSIANSTPESTGDSPVKKAV